MNAVFLTGINGLGLVKGFAVAAFLTTSEYGIWGILVVAIGTVLLLKGAGAGDKFVQQDEPGQELEFQRAFTVDLLWSLALMVLVAAALPPFALAYGLPELLAPGYVLASAIPALALQSPAWVFWRRMQFVRQRALQAVDPLATNPATRLQYVGKSSNAGTSSCSERSSASTRHNGRSRGAEM